MGLERIMSQSMHSPDILDCLAHLSSDEVFTPPELANQMLDLLPPEVWTNPDLKWLDPGSKTGVFLREIAKRLIAGLAEAISDEDERREHIFKNMLHGIAITELTGLISRRTVYYSKDASFESADHHSVVHFDDSNGKIFYHRSQHTFKEGRCIICGAPKSLERKGLENYAYHFIHDYDGSNMKFDVIVGNPPYQMGDDSTSTTPIYNLFVEKALELNPRYLAFIIPARWYAGGKGLDTFRKRMIEDRSIKVLVDYPMLFEAFPGVEIKGGVCYFLRDSSYEGDCEVKTFIDGKVVSSAKRDLRKGKGAIIRSNEAVSVFDKVQAKNETSITTKYANTSMLSQTPFGLHTNFKDHVLSKTEKHTIKLYIRGGVAWVEPAQITKNKPWVAEHKVFISEASDGHGRVPAKVIGIPIICGSATACTQTYLVAGIFDTPKEAENYAHFLTTKLVRFLVSLRKYTQHTKPDSFAFVPALDMKQKWTDQDLYKRYGLTKEEVAHVESQIKETKPEEITR
jgi:site-specific DNA-methyltransferase (adenine-specific)